MNSGGDKVVDLEQVRLAAEFRFCRPRVTNEESRMWANETV